MYLKQESWTMQDQEALGELVELCGGVLDSHISQAAITIAPDGSLSDSNDTVAATPSTVFVCFPVLCTTCTL